MAAVQQAALIARLINDTERLEAQMVEFKAAYAQNIDAFFLLTMAVVIYMMQLGFAFLEAGSVQSKNVTNMLLKNFLDSCVSALGFWTIGFALAYGRWSPIPGLFGLSEFFLPDPNRYAFFFFQYVFAATAATIVSGALAERCEFIAYLTYTWLVCTFVYPLIAHWCWDANGWLKQGFVSNGVPVTITVIVAEQQIRVVQDFAGSGVVHVLGGTIAFIGAYFLGPRIGRFIPHPQVSGPLKGHSLPFSTFGAFILGFGFLGFNGGSVGHISQPGDDILCARAMINTILAGTFAALFVLVLFYIENRRWTLIPAINGFLAGMVAVCASCDTAPLWGAVLIGFGAATVYKFTASLVNWMEVDDPVEAVAVHFGGGTWGLLIGPVFAHGGIVSTLMGTSTLPMSHALLMILWNLVQWATIVVWSAVWMVPVFLVLKKMDLLRVTEETELKGLDLYKHQEDAYPKEAYHQQHGHHPQRKMTLNVYG